MTLDMASKSPAVEEKTPPGIILDLIEVAIVIAATLWFEPLVALVIGLAILLGMLFAWLMGRARRSDSPISIIERKAPR